jgi:hypothetical protein
MKRISGGQLSREAKATLLSSHAGGPRTAAGDKTFVGQTKAADAVVKSQPAASPKDLPVGSDVTAQTTKHFDSDSRQRRRAWVPASRLLQHSGRGGEAAPLVLATEAFAASGGGRP